MQRPRAGVGGLVGGGLGFGRGRGWGVAFKRRKQHRLKVLEDLRKPWAGRKEDPLYKR
jgi:hypothetical protein